MKFIHNSYGEFDLSIRDDYFNIYYKGNSLAKVSFQKNGNYQVKIHSKFFDKTSAQNPKFYSSCARREDYFVIEIPIKQLHPFFQKKHLMELASRIKIVNNGEEIGFEQSIITDNLNNEKLIFIDRQITDSELKRKRLDLLALKQIKDNKYCFLICEVKLGNNIELKAKVASQLDGYIYHIKQHFTDYKNCYEKQYSQKKELGLFDKPTFVNIEIEEPIEGIIIVGGYSGIAKAQIVMLRKTHPNLAVKHFTYEL
jgi:hypothetical protein